MILPYPAAKRIADLDAQHAAARDRVMQALKGESTKPEDVLVRWILENDINPYGVFAPKWAADGFSTYEGIAGVMHTINHALVDDGDISFVECEGTEPMIIFLDHRETKFRDAFLQNIRDHGHGEGVIPIFEPVGTYPDVAAYITAYEAHAAYMKAAHEEIWGPDAD